MPLSSLRPRVRHCEPIRLAVLLILSSVTLACALAADVRERTRPKFTDSARVSAGQAQTVTLTVSPVTQRSVQSVLRAAGTLDATERYLTVDVCTREAQGLKEGQRARVFPVSARSSMHQGRVTRLRRDGQCTSLEVEITGRLAHAARHYMMEIIIDHGTRLCVANEAIIEEEGRRVVYVRRDAENFDAREVEVGLQGEAYTEILGGLQTGEQVVTIGSFFVDSEFKMQR